MLLCTTPAVLRSEAEFFGDDLGMLRSPKHPEVVAQESFLFQKPSSKLGFEAGPSPR
jgi:hypothetical protein